MPDCPRCRTQLRDGVFHEVDVDICSDCGGVLIPQNRLIPLLEGMSRELLPDLDADSPLDPVEDVGAGLCCPKCSGPMTNFGYMGMKTVMLDRCAACALLWLDAAELGGAALLHARTNLRRELREQSRAEVLDGVCRRLDRIRLERAARALVFRMLI